MGVAFLGENRRRTLIAVGALITIVATADRAVGNHASLGLFYILPMMLAGTVSPPASIVALGAGCSVLRSIFDLPCPPIERVLRFVFAALAYAGSGLFAAAMIRNRDQAVKHLERIRREQKLRQEAEEQLALLVESSPAAVVTTDSSGAVIASNKAARTLFLSESLDGKMIGDYVRLLADALSLRSAPEDFRTAAQCQGRRENGEVFLAQTWFSRYAAPNGTRLAAIVVDASEEMRDREEEGFRQLLRGNRIATAAVLHEVRNLCSAIALLCSNLKENHPLSGDADFQGLISLTAGLEKVAAVELSADAGEPLEPVELREVLDDLRIVIEPDWREIEGSVVWRLPPEMPAILAERHGLLQAFLNLAKNSHRAVQSCARRELRISVEAGGGEAHVRFCDTGPGIAEPERLFQPFQEGAEGSGLGLYISRAMLRGYGGELAYEDRAPGTCFRVDLPTLPGGRA